MDAFCFAVFISFFSPLGFGQSDSAASAPYVRKNAFGILWAYSNDSSHILIGQAEQRKLLNLGISYSRRLIAGRVVNWQYDAEILPVALESDPLVRSVDVQTSPKHSRTVFDDLPPMTYCKTVFDYSYTSNNITYSGVDTFTCHGRQWTIGEAISPIGMQFNFMPGRRLQPLVETHGGYIYSTHPIPILEAGSFNFTAEAGVGFEYFRTQRQSIRVEYRYHHISNDDTSFANPGIDNAVFQVAYMFGK